ncbi:MAG: hypothetical protein TREMPRED_004033 [Tremellales sp. Tagirdzhanova-0007]|nr:MAG: hypothetical protein TREMPRED_004033 [Tremellales sp. Tagirdzhanova-0007]
MSQVTASELHTIDNDPSTLAIAQGVKLSDAQRKHVAVVLDLFQAKGTMAKLDDNFTENAVYEDLFASAKNREEVAGQLLHLPTICQSARTLAYEVNSCSPTTTTDGTGTQLDANEILVRFKHVFEFKLPLPRGGREVEVNTTLVIFSSEETGKIVRLQDRPDEDIPDNAVLAWIRRMNAVGVPKVVGIPKDEKADAEKVMSQQR